MMNVKIDISPSSVNIKNYENKEIENFVKEPLVTIGDQMYLKYLVNDVYIEADGVNVKIDNVMDLHKKTLITSCKETIFIIDRVKKNNKNWKRREVVKALRYKFEGLIETVELIDLIIDRDLFLALDDYYNKHKK